MSTEAGQIRIGQGVVTARRTEQAHWHQRAQREERAAAALVAAPKAKSQSSAAQHIYIQNDGAKLHCVRARCSLLPAPRLWSARRCSAAGGLCRRPVLRQLRGLLHHLAGRRGRELRVAHAAIGLGDGSGDGHARSAASCSRLQTSTAPARATSNATSAR